VSFTRLNWAGVGNARNKIKEEICHMTWEQMVIIEPRLLELYKIAKSYKPTKNFCANQIWYRRGGLKSKMMKLAGYGAPGILGTPEAYDIAYQKIYNALPDCRHDGWC